VGKNSLDEELLVRLSLSEAAPLRGRFESGISELPSRVLLGTSLAYTRIPGIGGRRTV